MGMTSFLVLACWNASRYPKTSTISASICGNFLLRLTELRLSGRLSIFVDQVNSYYANENKYDNALHKNSKNELVVQVNRVYKQASEYYKPTRAE